MSDKITLDDAANAWYAKDDAKVIAFLEYLQAKAEPAKIDTDEPGFIVEHAEQCGFETIDDAAELMVVSVRKLIEFVELRQRNAPPIDLNELSINSICNTYIEAFGPLPEQLVRNDILWHIGELIKEAGAVPPMRSDLNWRLVPQLSDQAPQMIRGSFVQTVPDRCDRITWRGAYYHLPLQEQGDAGLLDFLVDAVNASDEEMTPQQRALRDELAKPGIKTPQEVRAAIIAARGVK